MNAKEQIEMTPWTNFPEKALWLTRRFMAYQLSQIVPSAPKEIVMPDEKFDRLLQDFIEPKIPLEVLGVKIYPERWIAMPDHKK